MAWPFPPGDGTGVALWLLGGATLASTFDGAGVTEGVEAGVTDAVAEGVDEAGDPVLFRKASKKRMALPASSLL